MKWYEVILMQLAGDTCIEESLLLEIPELIAAMKAKQSYNVLLQIVNEHS